MSVKTTVAVSDSPETKHIKIKEWVCIIGTILLYVLLGFILYQLAKHYDPPIDNDSRPELGELIWDSIQSVVSAAVGIIDFLAALAVIKTRKECSKTTVFTVSVFTYVFFIYGNVAIKYPLKQSTIILTVGFLLVVLGYVFVFKETRCNP